MSVRPCTTRRDENEHNLPRKAPPVVNFVRFLRPTIIQPVPIRPSDEDIQRMVYDLVRERVMRTLGPNGSFSITMRTGDDASTFFTETYAESLAWDVASQVSTTGVVAGSDSNDLAPAAVSPAVVSPAAVSHADGNPVDHSDRRSSDRRLVAS